MDNNFFRISDRVDALAAETYDSREKIAVHEAVCAARYEQITGNLARLDRRLSWTLYAVVLSAAVQLSHGTIQDWLMGVARSIIR
jgi:hypothetical protein